MPPTIVDTLSPATNLLAILLTEQLDCPTMEPRSQSVDSLSNEPENRVPALVVSADFESCDPTVADSYYSHVVSKSIVFADPPS